MCVYDEHPLAVQDIQYQAPDSQSRFCYQIDSVNSMYDPELPKVSKICVFYLLHGLVPPPPPPPPQ